MFWLALTIPTAVALASFYFKGVRGWLWAIVAGLAVATASGVIGLIWSLATAEPWRFRLGYSLLGAMLIAGYWFAGAVLGGCLGYAMRAARRRYP
jgi:hypothetical protein